jgi:hypothetical protein
VGDQPNLTRHYQQAEALPDYTEYTAKLTQAKSMQAEIWSDAVVSVRVGPPQLALLLLPALNDMIDITVAHEAVVSKYSVDVLGLVFQAKPSAPG